MKTAVQWLVEQLENHNGVTRPAFENVIQQAKEMEKQQIVHAWNDGLWGKLREGEDNAESYYTETFKSE